LSLAVSGNGFYCLDPDKTRGAKRHPDPPSEQLPLSARNFGFIPELELLRPGDLLLVSEIHKSLISRVITGVQTKAGFDAWHAQWHHAAVYVGNNLVCEAQLGGVRTSSIFRYVGGTHRVRFRRDPHLDELASCQIALEAALRLKYGYNWRSVVQLLTQAEIGWSGGSGKPRQLNSRATICSQLYADAYGVVTGSTLDTRAEAGISPAHLSNNKVLTDFPVKWLSLASDSNE
jgi:hypothetical protein